jgi:hypothetical protein
MRDAIAGFSTWLDHVSSSTVLSAFSTVSDRLRHHMPWVYETLRSANGRRIEDAARMT